ncbi:MAG: response regulator [Lachnospiraceae bacterium]|nr:response regulator [Lachnospiraceae bacterium]
MYIKTYDKTKNYKIIPVFKVMFLLAFIYALALLISYSLKDRSAVWESDEPVYIMDWKVIDQNGDSFEVEAPYRDERLKNEDFTIISTLPDDIRDGSYICFITRGNVDVYVDGELRKSFDRLKDFSLPGGTVKNFYILVPVEPYDSGKEVRMTRYRTDRKLEVVPEIFVAGPGGIHSVLLDKYGTSFVMSAMLLVLSGFIILIAVGIQLGYRRTISLMYASMGIFITAGWIITDSYLYPFVFGHYHIDGVVNYVLCMMLPLAFLLYIDSIQKGRYRKAVIVMLVASFSSLVVFSLLHFTGIFTFPQALLYIDLILGIVVFGVFAILVIDVKRGHAGDYKFTLIGFIGFILFSILTILMLTFMAFKNEGVVMLFGLIFLLAFVIMQQVADLRRITAERERAIQLSEAKTSFLAGMSHEIRTPINSIVGMNEMILRENQDPVIDGYARTVLNSSRMLLSLVNDVLDFSKIEAGKMEIMNSEFDLGVMLSEIEMIARERAQSKDLVFMTVFLNAVPRRIDSDEIRIKQVLVNLINNAVKYTDKGSVSLMISGSDGENGSYNLRFDVRDTGRGIKEEDRATLFDAFSRIDMNTNRNIEGTGLGLAIVNHIVYSMGGRISVESEYLVGSTFSVTLPVEVTDETPMSNISDEVGKSGGRREKGVHKPAFTAPDASILAVDDNKTNLSIVGLFLKGNGIVPDLCLSGSEAIDKCREKKYDLILLDHMMPDPDGIETLNLIRSDGASVNRETPAVVLTANAIAGSRQMYIDAGFADYLTKPLSSALLEETVRKYLPKEKVYEAGDLGRFHENGSKGSDQLYSKLSAIDGLDYDTALLNAGDDEDVLGVVIGEITKECDERIKRMRALLKDKNYKDYGINAHALKGLMATIGVNGLSERALKHELAAREEDVAFIDEDIDGFLEEYREFCSKLK